MTAGSSLAQVGGGEIASCDSSSSQPSNLEENHYHLLKVTCLLIIDEGPRCADTLRISPADKIFSGDHTSDLHSSEGQPKDIFLYITEPGVACRLTKQEL